MAKIRINKKRHKVGKGFPCVFLLLFLVVVLHACRDNLLHILLWNKESLDCEKTCDADNANDVAYCIGVIDDNVSCDCEYKDLEGVCGGQVNDTFVLK